MKSHVIGLPTGVGPLDGVGFLPLGWGNFKRLFQNHGLGW